MLSRPEKRRVQRYWTVEGWSDGAWRVVGWGFSMGELIHTARPGRKYRRRIHKPGMPSVVEQEWTA